VWIKLVYVHLNSLSVDKPADGMSAARLQFDSAEWRAKRVRPMSGINAPKMGTWGACEQIRNRRSSRHRPDNMAAMLDGSDPRIAFCQ